MNGPNAPRDDSLTAPTPADLDFVVTCLPIGVAIVTAEHVCRWANPRLVALAGQDLSALQGLDHQSFTAPDDREAEHAALAPLHAGRTTTAVWRRRFGVLTRPRTWCTVTAHGRHAADGELRDMVWLVVADPAAQEPLAQVAERRRARQQSERAELVAVLSHDAVQSTRMISAYAGLIAQGLRGGEVPIDARHVTSIQHASDDLRALLREAVACLRITDQVTAAPVTWLRGSLAPAVAHLVAQQTLPPIRIQADLAVDLEQEQLERCLHPVLEYAVTAASQVEVWGTVAEGGQRIEVVAHGATLDPAQATRAVHLGSRSATGGLTGLAVAKAILVASGGGLDIARTGGDLRLTLRVGPGSAPAV